jgi:hypothetical protein
MDITTTDEKFKILIKESVKEVLEAEIMQLRAFALPDVSDREQRDIERRYKEPLSSRKKTKSYILGV